ncbi:hypothetical protein KJ866_00340 [Patescibacteria group bacterium]|nr:hypothetical protein [Patescibacteria group bacterium]MBU2219893.1 hypothetical protein [Patescibacteria group bacterium]MBU2264587.1 hypothetical protein [Patescibacteria group bacterium]
MDEQLNSNIQQEQPSLQPRKPLNKTWQIVALTVVGVLVVGGVVAGSYYFWQKSAGNSNQTACTEEAKQCEDGSYVGRTGPNCEFAACPSVSASPSVVADETAGWQMYKNEQYGFELRYPKDWEISKTGNNEDAGTYNYKFFIKFSKLLNNEEGFKESFLIEIKNDNYENVYNKLKNLPETEVISSLREYSVNSDIKAQRLLTMSYGPGGSEYVVTTIFGNASDVFESQVSTTNPPNQAGQTVLKEVDQILSTFKFIHPFPIIASPKITSPKSGDIWNISKKQNITWVIGELLKQQNITWTTKELDSKADLLIKAWSLNCSQQGCQTILLPSYKIDSVDLGVNSYSWSVGKYNEGILKAGLYVLSLVSGDREATMNQPFLVLPNYAVKIESNTITNINGGLGYHGEDMGYNWNNLPTGIVAGDTIFLVYKGNSGIFSSTCIMKQNDYGYYCQASWPVQWLYGKENYTLYAVK